MLRFRACVLVSAVVAGLVVAVGPSAMATTGWSAAAQIATSSYGPSVAVDASGDAVAGWCDGNDHPTAMYRPAGGAWGSPATLEAGACSSGEPRVAIDASGAAIAVWGSNSEIHGATRTAGSGGSWSTAFVVSDVSGGPECLNYCINPRVTVDSAGRAIVAWQGTIQSGISWSTNAQVRTVDLADGTLNPSTGPLVLGGSQNADSITLAEDASGTAAIAWLDTTNASTNAVALPMWVTTLDTTSLPLTPTTPFEVSTHDGLGSNTTETLDIAISPSGWVSAVYPVDPTNNGSSPCPNTGCDLYVRDRAPNTGTWTSEAQLASGASFTTHQLGFAPDGTEILVWGDYSLACSGAGGACQMHAVIRPVTAAWGTSAVISSRPVYTDGAQPAVAADAANGFTVAWRGKDTADNAALPEAARYDSGSWSSEHDLGVYGAGSINGNAVVAAAGPAGSATAVWSDGAHLWDADYTTATAPATHTLTVSPTGTGSGSVTSNPTGIDCGATCSAPFADGTPVTLTATPGLGSVFSGWSGAGCSGTGTCPVDLTADTGVSALFTAKTALSIGTSKTVNYGTSVTVTTTLMNGATSHPMSGGLVALQAKSPSASTWSQVATRTTSSTGTASVTLTPHATTQYRWHYSGSGYVASYSATQTVTVRQVVLIHTTKTTVVHGIAFKIYGTVKPSGSGQKVYLQRLYGTTWKTIGYVYLKKQKLPNGVTTVGYIFSTKATTKGTFKFRVMKPATSTLAKGTSATVGIKIT